MIERDYVWSEAVELKHAFSTTIMAGDGQFNTSFTTPQNVQIYKLPVSPLLKDKISTTLECVLPLLHASTATIPSYALKQYDVSQVQSYLRDNVSDYNIQALNSIDYTYTDTTIPAVTTTGTINSAPKPKLLDHTAMHTTANTTTSSLLNDASLALLEHFRISNSESLYDNTDITHVRFLF